jgi:hypothetical protein
MRSHLYLAGASLDTNMKYLYQVVSRLGTNVRSTQLYRGYIMAGTNVTTVHLYWSVFPSSVQIFPSLRPLILIFPGYYYNSAPQNNSLSLPHYLYLFLSRSPPHLHIRGVHILSG